MKKKRYRFKPSNTFEAIQLRPDNLKEVLAFVDQEDEYDADIEQVYQSNRYLYMHLEADDVTAPFGSWIVSFSPGKFEWVDEMQFATDCEEVPE